MTGIGCDRQRKTQKAVGAKLKHYSSKDYRTAGRRLHKGIRQLIGKDTSENDEVKLLTSCPACQQGLLRYAEETGLNSDYIVVELARATLGEDWQEKFVARVNQGGIERVLL